MKKLRDIDQNYTIGLLYDVLGFQITMYYYFFLILKLGQSSFIFGIDMRCSSKRMFCLALG